jgi:hypothetical protein
LQDDLSQTGQSNLEIELAIEEPPLLSTESEPYDIIKDDKLDESGLLKMDYAEKVKDNSLPPEIKDVQTQCHLQPQPNENLDNNSKLENYIYNVQWLVRHPAKAHINYKCSNDSQKTLPVYNLPLQVLFDASVLELWRCRTKILKDATSLLMFPCSLIIDSNDARYHFELLHSYYLLGNAAKVMEILESCSVESLDAIESKFLRFDNMGISYTPPPKFSFISRTLDKYSMVFGKLVRLLKYQRSHPLNFVARVLVNGLVNYNFATIRKHHSTFMKRLDKLNKPCDVIISAHESFIRNINDAFVEVDMTSKDDALELLYEVAAQNSSNEMLLAHIDPCGFTRFK